MNINNKRGFSFMEMLVVVGILAVLALVVTYLLNPKQLITQGQDGNRVANIGTLDKAVSLYYSNAISNPNTSSMGTSSIIYISIPDPTATTTAGTNCTGIGFTGTGYHCASPSNYMKVDGTGWVPINFTTYPGGSPISSLPVDPTNTTSSGEYYQYITDGIGGYELMAVPAATKNASATADFIKGTNLALLGSSSSTATTTDPCISQSVWVTNVGIGGAPDLWAGMGGSTGGAAVKKLTLCGHFLAQYGSIGGSNGEFVYPEGIAIDGSGNIWVTDPENNRVQEFSSSGVYMSQFGSTGTGPGQFENPAGQVGQMSPSYIAIDGSGNLWVTDAGNNRIEKFSSAGAYISQFGTYGTSATGTFAYPGGIAIDGSGNIWVADTGNHRIQEFSSTGNYITKFGSLGSATGTFEYPEGIAIDGSGNIWVADSGNNRLQKFSSTTAYITKLGTAGTGNGQLGSPEGIAIDGSGNIWVADAGNNRIQKFSSTTVYLAKSVGAGMGNGQFETGGYLQGIAMDGSGNIWAADTENNRLEKFSSTTAAYISQFGSMASASGTLEFPGGIAMDGSGNIWVTDHYGSTVQEFSPSGAYVTQFGSQGTSTGQFENPQGIAIDGSGNMWVVDTGNNRIEKFSSAGAYISKFGSLGVATGSFESPMGIAIDGSGNILVVDTNNSRVQKFSSAGSYVSKFGSWGIANGQFEYPVGITIDGSGNLWVEDSRQISEFTAGGAFVTSTYANCLPAQCPSFLLSPTGGLSIDKNGNLWTTVPSGGGGNELQIGPGIVEVSETNSSSSALTSFAPFTSTGAGGGFAGGILVH